MQLRQVPTFAGTYFQHQRPPAAAGPAATVPAAAAPPAGGFDLQVPLGTAEWSTVSLFTRDLEVMPSHICPPLDNAPGQSGLPFGQLELPFGHLQMHFVRLQMHFVHLQMHFCASGAPPDALLCIWRCHLGT